jgi:hypothetical protein
MSLFSGFVWSSVVFFVSGANNNARGLTNSEIARCANAWSNATFVSSENIILGNDENPSMSGVPGTHGNRAYTFNNKALLIHLGKTGGGTTNSMLKDLGVPYEQIHVHPTPISAFVSHPLVIVQMRDPVARFVSVFNAWKELVSEKRKHSGQDLPHLFRCFRTPNELVQNAFVDATADPGCVQAAESIFLSLNTGISHGDLKSHIYQGVCYYFGGLVPFLQSKEVFVIAQETHEHDFIEMLAWLESNNVHARKDTTDIEFEHRHTSSHANESIFLTNSSRAALEERFALEYRIQNAILGSSINKKGFQYCRSDDARPMLRGSTARGLA